MVGNVCLTLCPDVQIARHVCWHEKVFIKFLFELHSGLGTGINQTETKFWPHPCKEGLELVPGFKKVDKKLKEGNHMSKEDLPDILSYFPVPRKRLSCGHGEVIRDFIKIWFPR